MNKLNQTLLKFELEQNFTYDDFFVSKCNYFAFSLIESWPKWEKNILNLNGEKYCGKSHLSEIFIKKNKGIIRNSQKIQINYDKNLRFYETIILDNFNDSLDEKIIFSLINFVYQNSKYFQTVFISSFVNILKSHRYHILRKTPLHYHLIV